ncbi:MAG: hypothetical protein JXA60_09915 [Candidatus Coatesbacteria bacterium]|nr:hypothetical protein [Candidatus Coatesbacteria bacterium]
MLNTLIFILFSSVTISKIPFSVPYSLEEQNCFMLNPFWLINNDEYMAFSAQYGRILLYGKSEIYFPLQVFTDEKDNIFDKDPLTGKDRFGKVSGFGGGFGIRYYPLSRFSGPFVGCGGLIEALDGYYQAKDESKTDEKYRFTGIGLSPYAEIGYRWLWIKGITVTPRIIPKAMLYTIKADSVDQEEHGWEYNNIIDISIGITY